MTTTVDWPQLTLLTLRDPKAAAAEIMSWQLPRDALWMAAIVVAIAGTIMSTLTNFVMPLPEPFTDLFPNPIMLFLAMAGGFVLTVNVLFWTGRAIGGSGDLNDLLALLVWMQALRATAQLLILICVLVTPFLTGFLVLLVGIATIWVFLNFLSVGLQLNSLLKAVLVVFAAALALSLGVSLLLSMIGVSAIGVPANV
ncbi:YIP1 family protein [Roseobacter sp. YSTF-M11]|uniref:YIP1 family protein n=1 Tax=Roseobacter insulae TaxID=2859783 RepID=A0A9X1K2U1_9RHOB|nr:YIP1 family protein [Roseobacter insulae]MBW4708898.1 YIP1 family protein [Roseobacter insulae]